MFLSIHFEEMGAVNETTTAQVSAIGKSPLVQPWHWTLSPQSTNSPNCGFRAKGSSPKSHAGFPVARVPLVWRHFLLQCSHLVVLSSGWDFPAVSSVVTLWACGLSRNVKSPCYVPGPTAWLRISECLTAMFLHCDHVSTCSGISLVF